MNRYPFAAGSFPTREVYPVGLEKSFVTPRAPTLMLTTMVDEPKYTLGRARANKKPELKWEDLDEKTRNQITETVVRVVRANELVIESMRPVIESVRAVVVPLAEQYSDFMFGASAVFEQLAQLGDVIRTWVPNWSKDVDPEKAWAVTAEGIPLAFVPRAHIVDELIAADDLDARLKILRRSKKLILTDCRVAVLPDEDDPFHESISMLLPLLNEAMDALAAGHAASACALGVSVIDSALHRTSKKKVVYDTIRNTATTIKIQKALAQNTFRTSMTIRPLCSLFEDWHPKKGTPPPLMPSRHVIAHWADPNHMSETNAIIIAMAATSLLLGIDERETVADWLTRSKEA